MFEKVCKPCPAWLFVFRADVIPNIDGDDGGLLVLMHDKRQAVLQRELLEGDIDISG